MNCGAGPMTSLRPQDMALLNGNMMKDGHANGEDQAGGGGPARNVLSSPQPYCRTAGRPAVRRGREGDVHVVERHIPIAVDKIFNNGGEK